MGKLHIGKGNPNKKPKKMGKLRKAKEKPLLSSSYIQRSENLADSLLHNPQQDVVIIDLALRIQNLICEIRRLKLSKS